MQLLIQVSMHAHFIAFLKNALVDQLLFFSPSRVSQRFGGTREHELILGNKGTKPYKSEEKNIVSKFMKRGVNKENVWEHRAILEGNIDSPPGRLSLSIPSVRDHVEFWLLPLSLLKHFTKQLCAAEYCSDFQHCSSFEFSILSSIVL